MTPKGGNVLRQDTEKDFDYYVFRVRQATWLYDKAIENDTHEHENDMAMINVPALEECQDISSELLGDVKLPPEHRILLNYYMAAQQDKHLSILYLKSALEVVEMLESVNGVTDPMREILETQLNDTTNRAYPPGSPVQMKADNNGFLNCFPRKYPAPSILREKCLGSPKPSPDSEATPGGFPSYGMSFLVPTDAQVQPTNLPSGPETVPERHLGDGLVLDTIAQSHTICSPLRSNAPETAQDQPSIVITDGESEDSRSAIIRKIQYATMRRQTEMKEGGSEGDRDCLVNGQ